MEVELSGHYLVVGTNGGVGRAVTAALESDGCAVTGIDLPSINLAESDVLARHIETLWESSGPFDGLVHAAGLYPAVRATDTSEVLFDQLLAVNARSALVASATLAKLSEAAGRALAIVVVSSVAAARPQNGTVAYSASKAALEAIVRGLALELGPSGVRVNAVAPGFIDVASAINPIPRYYIDSLAATAPQKRVGTPADIVPVIVWLLSEGSHWINGQTIAADGGSNLGWVDGPTWLKTQASW
jgi:3-oxoacyl-[acyl-carrier protein] reductase